MSTTFVILLLLLLVVRPLDTSTESSRWTVPLSSILLVQPASSLEGPGHHHILDIISSAPLGNAHGVPESREDFCFVSFGCWGGHNLRTQKKVAKVMGALCDDMANKKHTEANSSRQSVRFVLAAGDNFYKAGVQSVSDVRFQSTYEGVYQHPALVSVPWLMALGNHDYRGNVDAQVEYTNHSRRWFLPHRYYAVEAYRQRITPGVEMVMEVYVLDATLLERCHNNGDRHIRCTDGNAQRHWLEETLQASKRQQGNSVVVRILVCHYPLFANGPHVNHRWLVEWLEPLIDQYSIPLYINADNHYMQVSRKKVETSSTLFVNSGGGGGYARHLPSHKGYHRNQHSIFESLTDGVFVHCLSSAEHSVVLSTVGFNDDREKVFEALQQFPVAKGVAPRTAGKAQRDDNLGLIVPLGIALAMLLGIAYWTTKLFRRQGLKFYCRSLMHLIHLMFFSLTGRKKSKREVFPHDEG